MQKKAKIVLLDNNDSFTYNWVELLRQVQGEEPIVVSHDFKGELPYADAYLFSPGPGLPSEKPLMKKVMDAFSESKPILGVCLGHQFIAEYFGAKLYNLGKLNHGIQAEIYESGECKLFKGIKFPVAAGLYHSWAVESGSLEKTALVSIAQSDGLVMALEHQSLPITGVQFHPESFLTEEGPKLIDNWLQFYVYPNMTS